ncbi:cadherin domain protein, partial [Dictyocaulus viviparus]
GNFQDVNSHVSSSKSFTVTVQDVNDVVPQFTVDLFTGTVDEELTPAEYLEKFGRKPITIVKAVDADSNGPQNEVHYRILDVPDSNAAHLFRIDELTGEIWPNAKFDREEKDMYLLTVEARDNSPSALPGASGPNKGESLGFLFFWFLPSEANSVQCTLFSITFIADNVKVQIVIGDVNDNAPSFDEAKYIGKVLENADAGHDIITIKAHDMDKHSTLRYDVIAAQGGRIPFGARTDSGAIFVKEPLDYEQESVYHLKLLVSDGRHNASTDVFIYVEDVNDNSPVFDQVNA